MVSGTSAVLIAGPTASGKSALALHLARRLGGVVVNADSMQVYRDLRVITARPTPADEAQAPHRLYGCVDGSVNYSVARFLADAGAAFTEVRERNALPIFIGGTGLYLKALLHGLAAVPLVPEDIRQRVRRDGETRETAALHADLAEKDPDTALRLKPNDRLRVLRGLEMFAATGRPLGAFRGQGAEAVLSDATTVRVFLSPDREELRRRIDARFLSMVAHGAREEVAALAERGLDPRLPVMRAHGVPGLHSHLRGECSLDEAIAAGQGDTRRYVKRQFTWFRNQMPGWAWFTPEDAERAVLASLDQRTWTGPS